MHEVRKIQHLRIVAEMDLLRIEGDQSLAAQVVVADRIDEQVIERKNAEQRDDCEDDVVHGMERDVARAKFLLHTCLSLLIGLNDALAAEQFGHAVREEQQDDADHRLQHADRGGEREVVADQASIINVEVKHLDMVLVDRVLEDDIAPGRC